MNEAEGDELAALALEARTLKEQIVALKQIEPSVDQGIQSLQRGEPQRTSILPQEFTPAPQDDEGYRIYKEGYGKERIFPGIRTPPISEHQVRFTKQKPIYRAMKGRMDRKPTERLEEMFKRHRPSRANGGRIPFADGSSEYDTVTTLEENPELHKKMNDAATKAQNEYVAKIQSGEIPFPDNLAFEMSKIGDKARHDVMKSQGITSDPTGTQNLGVLHPNPETGKRILSNQQRKDKRLRELMDQTKGTIEFDPNNVEINKAGMIPDNFIEQIESLWGGEPEAATGIMKAGGYPFMDPVDGDYIPRQTMASNWSELDDLEAQEADARRQMELRRLANTMDQYPVLDKKRNFINKGWDKGIKYL